MFLLAAAKYNKQNINKSITTTLMQKKAPSAAIKDIP